MKINGDVDLPVNATAKIGQTSLLGTVHVAWPRPPMFRRKAEHEISHSLRAAATYPTTEKLAVLRCCSTAAGWEVQDITGRLAPRSPARKRPTEPDPAVRRVHAPQRTKDDINRCNRQLETTWSVIADQKPWWTCVTQHPDALAVLKEQRDNLVDAFDAR